MKKVISTIKKDTHFERCLFAMALALLLLTSENVDPSTIVEEYKKILNNDYLGFGQEIWRFVEKMVAENPSDVRKMMQEIKA